jgi:PLP dependent protein
MLAVERRPPAVTPSSVRATLSANLAGVEERLSAACRRASRSRAEVALVAVTKTVSAEVARHIVELGVVDLGESRAQELWHKADLLPPNVRWHLIGHLQRNKIDRTLPLVSRIHSVDSLRLLAALDEAARLNRPLDVMLEFNCSGEANKGGFVPSEATSLVPVLRELKVVRVTGLMTMAAFEDDPERCRPTFALLRQLRGELHTQLRDKHPIADLSMGMSNDFEVAVEEGATLVRLGSVLFAGVPEGGET